MRENDGVRAEVRRILEHSADAEAREDALVEMVYRHRQAVTADTFLASMVSEVRSLANSLSNDFGELSNLVMQSRRLKKEAFRPPNAHEDVRLSVRALASSLLSDFGELSDLLKYARQHYRPPSPAERRSW